MSIKEAAVSSVTVVPYAHGAAASVQGELSCPPDKSVTHRSVMLGAMAKGESIVVNPLMGADCRSTMGVMRALGVRIDETSARSGIPASVRLYSPGWDSWRSPLVPLDYGNSGTTARLLTGVFAASPGLFLTCFGDASLSKRPMARVVSPLRQIGAHIAGREDGQLLPMAITGQKLRPAEHIIDKATAQVKSALLLAGLNVSGVTQVTLPAGSRDHTERMLAALGAELSTTQDRGVEVVRVKGPFRPPARLHLVPGDPSSAAFFAVLGVITSGVVTIRGVLDNPTRTGFVDILQRMGGRLERVAKAKVEGALEPVMDLMVRGGAALNAIETTPEAAPTFIDEVPILAVAALFARGQSRFRGLGELRVKESDRLAKVLELLQAVQAKAWAEGDDLLIEGQGHERHVPPFLYNPEEDHRLAMAAAVLAKVAKGPCQIQDPACVAVSFPGFFDALESVR